MKKITKILVGVLACTMAFGMTVCAADTFVIEKTCGNNTYVFTGEDGNDYIWVRGNNPENWYPAKVVGNYADKIVAETVSLDDYYKDAWNSSLHEDGKPYKVSCYFYKYGYDQRQWYSMDEVKAMQEKEIETKTAAEAAQAGKGLGEYMNNAITSVRGLDEVVPVAQGGKVILDGEQTNITLITAKPHVYATDCAKKQAAEIGGTVMNVVDIKTNAAKFNVATVNFYTPGVTADTNVAVYRFNNGVLTEEEVVEVRDDHIVVNMTALGTLIFIQK